MSIIISSPSEHYLCKIVSSLAMYCIRIPADAAVAVRRTSIKNSSHYTHGKPASLKLRNTLLGYTKKQQIVEFMLLHSKNALEIILEDPNIQKFSGGTCP